MKIMFNEYYQILEYDKFPQYLLHNPPETLRGLAIRYSDKSLLLFCNSSYLHDLFAQKPNWKQCDKIPFELFELLNKNQYIYLMNLFNGFIFNIFWFYEKKNIPNINYEAKQVLGRMITERNRRTKRYRNDI